MPNMKMRCPVADLHIGTDDLDAYVFELADQIRENDVDYDATMLKSVADAIREVELLPDWAGIPDVIVRGTAQALSDSRRSEVK